MTGQDLLRLGIAQLRAAGVPDPATDARRLIARALGLPPERLTLALTEDASPQEIDVLQGLIEKRAARQPVAQIIGQRQFWGRSFRVTPDVLDPRPETETLIAAALERPAQRILDLGAGTGCIALTLLAEWPDATAVLSDISPAALAVARANAEALGVDARATFLISDWFAAVEGAFDLILSNPPYISASEMAELSPDVRDWEPHLALTPGGDGLSAYRRIAEGLRGHIASNGRALLEIGANQAADVSDIVRETEPQHLTVLTDLGGRDRAIALQY